MNNKSHNFDDVLRAQGFTPRAIGDIYKETKDWMATGERTGSPAADRVQFVGQLQIDRIYPGQAPETIFLHKNKIVNKGLEIMAKLMNPTSTSPISITAATYNATAQTRTITATSVANPTVVTTSASHGLTTGQVINITGSNGTPNVDGTWPVTVLSGTTFSIPVNVAVGGNAGTVNCYPASVITTASAHGYTSGNYALITGAGGNTSINGAWTISAASGSVFTVPVAGNGTYTSGGTVQLLGLSGTTTLDIPGAIAVGTGNTAVSSSDTALVAEYARKPFTATSFVSSGGVNSGVKFEALYGLNEGNSASLNEAGLFSIRNPSSAGPDMIARVVTGTINKTTSFSLNFIWTITFTTT